MAPLLISLLLLAADPPAPPAATPPPAKTFSVRDLAQVGAAGPGQASPLSPGRFRALYIDGAAGVTWEVTPATLAAAVRFEELPATTRIFGLVEGAEEEQLHRFPETAGTVLFVKGVGLDDPVTVVVQAWGVRDGKAAKLAEVPLLVGSRRKKADPGPGPSPPPAPQPQPPTPGPVRTTGEAWFAIVDRPAARAPKFAWILDDRVWLNTLEKLPGVKDIRTYSTDAPNPDPVAKSFIDLARTVLTTAYNADIAGKFGIPVIVAVDKGGKVYLAEVLADTKAGVEEQVKKVLAK